MALARALAVEPRVLLLDEPFGALDAKVRRDLRRWLREIHDRTGHTTIFVTHDQEEALELADRVAVMNDGRIEQVGTPDEFYDRPATPFVAGFVGEAVRLPVDVREGRAYVGERRLALRVEGHAEGAANLFVRPHDVMIGEAEDSCRRVSWPCDVQAQPDAPKSKSRARRDTSKSNALLGGVADRRPHSSAAVARAHVRRRCARVAKLAAQGRMD